jgi:hypothetical protein
MKMSKRLLIGMIGLSLSISATAIEFKDKVLQSAFVEPAKVTQLKALTVQPGEELMVFNYHALVSPIVITDYGAELITKAPTLISNVSYIANTAKVQNQNFERM